MGYRVTASPEGSAADQSGAQVQIYFTRWFPESNDFKTAISRRRFVK
jgi:hypothetical protein